MVDAGERPGMRRTGLEPATATLVRRGSIRLSYRRDSALPRLKTCQGYTFPSRAGAEKEKQAQPARAVLLFPAIGLVSALCYNGQQ